MNSALTSKIYTKRFFDIDCFIGFCTRYGIDYRLSLIVVRRGAEAPRRHLYAARM
ncbi:MAG: hypothetical protein E7A34_02070 [Leclercia adecarboxylata]|nr:hypothetical protein [Leclercia adecarboxylata]